MAKNKNIKRAQNYSPKKPIYPEDFEKTVLDIDLRTSDKKLEETLIFDPSFFKDEKTRLHPEEVETRIFPLDLEPEPEPGQKEPLKIEIIDPKKQSFLKWSLVKCFLLENLKKIKKLRISYRYLKSLFYP